VSLDDWITALHLLSAFALVGAMVALWFAYLVLRADGTASAALGRLFQVGAVVVGIAITGTLVFGVWLSISIDGYEPWDGWVIAAIVLWAIAGGTGDRAGKLSREPGGVQQALVLHAVSSLAIVLILIDMIWKPGA
jgi:cytochrome bd-type quinol oxidase subunit 2